MVYGDRGYRGCEGVIVCGSREMTCLFALISLLSHTITPSQPLYPLSPYPTQFSTSSLNHTPLFFLSQRNFSKAVDLFQKACSMGNSLSCTNLGHLYIEGRGAQRNYPRAVEWEIIWGVISLVKCTIMVERHNKITKKRQSITKKPAGWVIA